MLIKWSENEIHVLLSLQPQPCPGGGLNITMSSYQYRDPMLKIRRSRDRLIFNMGIPIPGKDGLHTETGTRKLRYLVWSPYTCVLSMCCPFGPLHPSLGGCIILSGLPTPKPLYLWTSQTQLVPLHPKKSGWLCGPIWLPYTQMWVSTLVPLHPSFYSTGYPYPRASKNMGGFAVPYPQVWVAV